MSKWYCPRCGFMYNEAVGDENLKIPPKTLFSSFDSSWVCPRCQTPKELFVEVMA
ncbi:rubredoxin [Methanospirillum purgamenti]|uniref:Rubredoxin n=2 Tax=Methanospirillum TaxID=2202 RepID=A0A8F5ZHI6_METHU|nr:MULTISPECIES: rubredoxin [Methanospirillum]MDX8550878.1 rubredoxin [Methanospirillum hungatei]QXO94558.1 rubredoxin [Methanospirillum hungatei]